MHLEKRHDLGKVEALERVDKIADGLCARYNLNSAWDGEDLRIRGNGVDGRIVVDEETVQVDIKLSFVLAMLEGSIRTGVEEAMDEYLA